MDKKKKTYLKRTPPSKANHLSIVSSAEFTSCFEGHNVVDTQQISQQPPQRLIVEKRVTVTHFGRQESEAWIERYRASFKLKKIEAEWG